MKELIEKASTEQLDKLLVSCNDFLETCYEIDEAETGPERFELKCQNALVRSLTKVLQIIIVREEEVLRQITDEISSEEEEGAI